MLGRLTVKYNGLSIPPEDLPTFEAEKLDNYVVSTWDELVSSVEDLI